jgi:glycosyltransferase involved in cell wall biosynthesis
MTQITKRPSILIINQQQFGYHSDTYYYCKYLSTKKDVTYICWDYGLKKLTLPNVCILYVSRQGNLPRRNLRFIFQARRQVCKTYDYNFIKYFNGCILIMLLSGRTNFLLDIRSWSVLAKKSSRMADNLCLKFETTFFRHVSVISKSLAARLNILHRAKILPIGAEILSKKNKSFDKLNILYVGTLHNRNLDQVLKGFAIFLKNHQHKIPVHFTLIGSGFGTEEEQLKDLVRKLKLQAAVDIIGQVPHDELTPYFDTHNIGVSYIPKTDYFDVQPPTKTFEYLLSGMPVIATGTYENQRIITNENGVLIRDTAEGFYHGLVQMYQNLHAFDSNRIRDNARSHTWKNIVKILDETLDRLIFRNR